MDEATTLFTLEARDADGRILWRQMDLTAEQVREAVGEDASVDGTESAGPMLLRDFLSACRRPGEAG